MFSKTVTFKNFLGKEVTKTYHFHMSEFDIFNLEYKGESLTEDKIRDIVRSDDNAAIMRLFCFLLTSAVGIPDEDGNVFVKDPKIREEFSSSNALPAVVYSLANDKDITGFVSQLLGIDPKDLPKPNNTVAKNVVAFGKEPDVNLIEDLSLTEALDIINKRPDFVLKHLGGGRYDVIDPLTNTRARA